MSTKLWNVLGQIKKDLRAGRMSFRPEEVQVLVHLLEHGYAPDPDDIPGWVRKLLFLWRRTPGKERCFHTYTFANELEAAARGRR